MAPTGATRDATCSVATLSVLVRALDGWGHDVDAILAAGGLVRSSIADEELRIPQERFLTVWLAALEHTGDPALGLHVIETLDRVPFRLLTYIASSAPTAREAYLRTRRYIGIAHDGLEFDLQIEADRSICETRMRGVESPPFLAEYSVGLIIKVAPSVVGRQTIREAWFRHPAPAHRAEYDRILQVPIRFDAPCNAIVGDPSALDDALPRADESLCDLLEEQAAGLLAKLPPPDDFAARVRHSIAHALPGGEATAEHVATVLGLSPRTLRRRLSESGLSFRQLLDDVRHELAERALSQPGASVSEVAFLLGFSDTSAFHKAFRRWTGRRPSDLLRAEEPQGAPGRAAASR